MSWESVAADIDWNSDSWNVDHAVVGNLTDADKSVVLAYLEDLYSNSPSAAALLERGAANGPIRIGAYLKDDDAAIANSSGGEAGQDSFVAFNISNFGKSYILNDQGQLVRDDPRLTVAHELSHLIDFTHDPQGLGSGNPSFDYKGGAVDLENSVAGELGLTNEIRASYNAATFDWSSRFAQLSIGSSYSDGQHVDVAIFGRDVASAAGDSPDDLVDLSSRMDSPVVLAFGFGGNDTIISAGGWDHLYGQAGNDSLSGQSGEDTLSGGDGDDTISGGEGNDSLDGGPGTDSLSGGAGNDVLADMGGGTTYRSADDPSPRDVLHGGGGDDTLTSNSDGVVLVGGAGNDLLDARGVQTWDAVVRFTVGSGHDRIATDTFTSRGDYGDEVLTYSHIEGIDFGSLTAADLELHFTNWSVIHDYGSFQWIVGDVSIVIKSTGETLDLGRTDGYFYADPSQTTIFDEDVWRGDFDGQWSYSVFNPIAQQGGYVFD